MDGLLALLFVIMVLGYVLRLAVAVILWDWDWFFNGRRKP